MLGSFSYCPCNLNIKLVFRIWKIIIVNHFLQPVMYSSGKGIKHFKTTKQTYKIDENQDWDIIRERG